MKKFRELLEEDVLEDTAKKLGEKNEKGRLRLEIARMEEEKDKVMRDWLRKIEAKQKQLTELEKK